ncbi:MAG: GHMP kinase [Bacilli bacterium]|nr:GHMP kinase [Bacilli bacterium]
MDKRTREYDESISNIGVVESTISYTSSGAERRVVDEFKRIYGKNPSYTTFTPYTICPIGAHTDHNLGLTLSFALDKGIHIAYHIKMNGVIELNSLQFKKRAQWHVLETPDCEGDWADNLRGATIALGKRYPLRYGLSAVMDGELPIGGSSSSSAMIISFINALAFLNNIKLDNESLIQIASEADTKYVGVNNGKLNYYSELRCVKNHLLYMDMKDDSYELIGSDEKDTELCFGVFFSGIDNLLSSGSYNRRVEELRCSSYLIKTYAGMDRGRINDSNMRDIDKKLFIQYRDKLPDEFIKRSEHFYEECDRVRMGVTEYRNGNIAGFGKLMNESGYSSIHKWETGSKELIDLYEVLKSIDGVYGCRFSGAGFKGCCIALIDPDKKERIMKEAEEKYLSIYPELKGKYSSHICHTADGIKL